MKSYNIKQPFNSLPTTFTTHCVCTVRRKTSSTASTPSKQATSAVVWKSHFNIFQQLLVVYKNEISYLLSEIKLQNFLISTFTRLFNFSPFPIFMILLILKGVRSYMDWQQVRWWDGELSAVGSVDASFKVPSSCCTRQAVKEDRCVWNASVRQSLKPREVSRRINNDNYYYFCCCGYYYY